MAQQQQVRAEPRERPWKFDLDLDALALPAIVAGGLIFTAVYKDQLADLITKVVDTIPHIGDILGGIDVDVEIPQIPSGGGGGGNIPAGTTLWTSSAWGNGKSRTITDHQEHDPSDSRLMISAGSGRKGTFPGNGTAILQGDQSRFYILANNYNSAMFMTVNARNGLDNLSLKLRSRHGEGGAGSNRFGGYGVSFHFKTNEIESKREDYHNVHTSLGSCKSPVSLGYNRDINVGMSCQDNGKIVNLGGYINGKRVCTFLDKSPKGYMMDHALYNKKSYSWIRTNGSGSALLKNVVIKEIGPLSGSNLAYAYNRYRLGYGIPAMHQYQRITIA